MDHDKSRSDERQWRLAGRRRLNCISALGKLAVTWPEFSCRRKVLIILLKHPQNGEGPITYLKIRVLPCAATGP
jgi:hypothetical protein